MKMVVSGELIVYNEFLKHGAIFLTEVKFFVIFQVKCPN